MGKNLVIVESPAKAKTIGKILGEEFVVMSSMGHVRDLPIKKFGVNIKKGFKPDYVVVKGRQELVDKLKKAASTSVGIYLAPDPDREGEAIAWHLQCLLEKSGKDDRFHRVFYNEITPRAVREAFTRPEQVDMKRVHAQQARRILDRIVGYKVSPLLWARMRGAPSAGRVQSVALRLVCEREKLIIGFKAEEYWLLGARVRKFIDPLDPFDVKLARIDDKKAEIKSSEQATAIVADLEGRKLQVGAIIPRDITRRAPPPFITSSLQQAMSARFGMSASQTMRIAQGLYEGVDIGGETVGLITYMRTDSLAVAQEAIQECRGLIGRDFGEEFLPAKPNFYKSRESAQGAHEAIRPTDVRRTPELVAGHLNPADLKVYRAIWERFVASQMSPALIRQTTAEVVAPPPEGKTSTYLFRATSSEVVFPGFMKVTGVPQKVKPEAGPEEEAGEDASDEPVRLPPLAVGEALERIQWLSDRKETHPPARYTEGSLIRELEQKGVGRPSTYAQILSTLLYRKYITKEKRALAPTTVGMSVSDFLVGSLPELFDVQFTARMEEDLDKIEDGSVDWEKMVGDFYEKFVQWVEKAKGPPADIGKVRMILGKLGGVSAWTPATTYGKRTYSDEKFVKSLQVQAEKGEKDVSERQLAALARIAVRYEEQVPGIGQAVTEAGLAEGSAAQPVGKPSELTMRRLTLLASVQCDPPVERRGRTYDDREFIDSVRRRADGGRELSPAQQKQVDRLLAKYSAAIPGFEDMRVELFANSGEGEAPDTESEGLIDAMKHVVVWKPAVKRGKREFSDKDFHESVRRQFGQRRSLSEKQRKVLKRMVSTYRDQIPGFDEIAAKYALLKTGAQPAPKAESSVQAEPERAEPQAEETV